MAGAPAGTVMTPGGTTGLNRNAYESTIEEATYQRMKLIPVADEYTGRIYGAGIVRKYARVAGSTLGQSATGADLTYLSIIGTPVTITPVGSVVPIGWSQNEASQIDVDLESGGRDEIARSLAELTETNVAANLQSGTVIVSVASVDAPTLRIARARLVGNTNGMADGKKIYAFFSHTQEPALMTIPEVNSAEMRGDSENPYIKGLWVNGFGLTLMTSTVVAQDGNGWHNGVFLEDAIVTGWNTRTMIKRQEEELFHRLIAYNNMGSAVQHDARMVIVRTTDNPL